VAEFKPAVGQAVSLLSTVVDTAGDLGVVLDRQLSLDTHVTAVFRSGDYGTVTKVSDSSAKVTEELVQTVDVCDEDETSRGTLQIKLYTSYISSQQLAKAL